MNKPDVQPHPIPCRDCSAGMMHPRLITYFTWLGEELITVPNFPAWICDMCGKRDYDEKAISWLSMLLNPTAGKPTRKKLTSAKPRRAPRHAHPSIDS